MITAKKLLHNPLRGVTGFTLIELLIVIAIIGILSTIATVSLASSQRRARDGQRKSDIKQIQNALEIYFNNNSAYPTSTSGAITSGGWGSTWISSPGSTNYMRIVPSDPLSPTQQYCYSQTGGGTGYGLYALMEGPAVAGESEYTGSPFTCNGVATYNYRAENPF